MSASLPYYSITFFSLFLLISSLSTTPPKTLPKYSTNNKHNSSTTIQNNLISLLMILTLRNPQLLEGAQRTLRLTPPQTPLQ